MPVHILAHKMEIGLNSEIRLTRSAKCPKKCVRKSVDFPFYYDRDRLIYDFVVSPWDHYKFKGVGKNEPCPCGSGGSFGDCCKFKVREFDKFMKRIKLQSENKHYNPYGIANCAFHQENIYEYYTRNTK